MRTLGFAAMFAAVFASYAVADDSIPIETVKQIKAATVFVKVRGRGTGGTGSGFLIKAENDTGYLVTNYHVVSLSGKLPASEASVWVVFASGSKAERSTPAEVLATDAARDLAIIKVSGMKDLPKPIDLLHEAELVETLPVTAFGFPLGADLTQGKENPEMTIVRGAVSSLRTDAREAVESVQIDGGLLPGNSGGPVVDNKGQLVGVVVAGIPGTSVCWAIPPRHLSELLAGRMSGDFEVKTAKIVKGSAEIEVVATVMDPLGKLKSISVHVLKADANMPKPKPNAKGEWEKLANARKVDLAAKGKTANGSFPLKTGTTDVASYVLQGSFVTADGKVHYTEPAPFEINLREENRQAKGPPWKDVLVASGGGSETRPRSSSSAGPSPDAQQRMNDLRDMTRRRMEELKARSKTRRP